MNNIKLSVLFSLLLLLFPEIALAKKEESASIKVDAKCYVELANGSKIISFWNIKPSELKALNKNVIGTKTMTTSGKSMIINKAFECVLLNDFFSVGRANTVDSSTPR